MYISVCLDYSNMLVLGAYEEGGNVHGKGKIMHLTWLQFQLA